MSIKKAIERFEEKCYLVDMATDEAEAAEKEIGEAIRKERIYRKISLRKLAKKIGISAPYLSDIELGRRFPSQEVMKKILKNINS